MHMLQGDLSLLPPHWRLPHIRPLRRSMAILRVSCCAMCPRRETNGDTGLQTNFVAGVGIAWTPMNSVRLPCIEPCFKRARRHTSFFVFYTSFCNRSWHHHLPASLSMKMRITTKAVISPNHCNQGWAATSAREMRAAGFTTNILDSRSNSGGETAGAL